MSNVIYLNTGYEPTLEEEAHFHFIQACHNNFRRTVEQEEPERYWQVVRLSAMCHSLREKLKVINGGEVPFKRTVHSMR